MKVLHLSTFDVIGGAARATYRLHEGLRALDVSSQMLVRIKASTDPHVHGPERSSSSMALRLAQMRPYLNALPTLPYGPSTPFSSAWLPDATSQFISHSDPDVINLHWITSGFVRIESLGQYQRPIVWTLHDMWPFTGGCHYDDGCERYQLACGRCPQLQSAREHDLSRWVWKRKRKAWRHLDLTIVTPSQWLGSCAASSSLFGHFPRRVIPNGIDTSQFAPTRPADARRKFNIPINCPVILFLSLNATSDRRKGFHLLQECLARVHGRTSLADIHLVVAGADDVDPALASSMPTVPLGYVEDEKTLAGIYSMADVFVAPSIQDNLPNTVLEALACGTPTVAFDVGGFPDLIDHRKNGYLAEPFDTEDLAQGITWALEHRHHRRLRISARNKVTGHFSLAHQAHAYRDLYRERTTSHS